MAKIKTITTPSQEEEPLRYTRPVAIPGMEIATATQCSIYFRVFHEKYNIGAVASAATDWRYRGKSHFATDNDIMFVEPGETHVHTSMLKPATFKVFWFDTPTFESAAQELGLPGTPHFRVAQAHAPNVLAAFEQLYQSIKAEESALEQQSRFASCLRLLIGGFVERSRTLWQEENKHVAAILRAEAYLREHFCEPISLQQLSLVAGLSRFHLLRMFSRHFGIPPHAYQNALRMSHARSLLGEGASVASAAALTGFADQSHLARHYKKFFGTTPNRYVTMVRR